MNFRQKTEKLVGKTTDYEFNTGCSAATIYIKENYIDGSLRESHIVEIVAGFIRKFRAMI